MFILPGVGIFLWIKISYRTYPKTNTKLERDIMFAAIMRLDEVLG
jgi:hypothetical protein